MIRDSKFKKMLRHFRIRKKISGTAQRPRMGVTFTANNMYVQFIDDDAAVTLAAESTLSKDFKALGLKRNVEAAKALGKLAAGKAAAAGITEVVFDRGGIKYHGRIKALADAAREAGLKF